MSDTFTHNNPADLKLFSEGSLTWYLITYVKIT